jgi:hypothetical protein
VALDYVWTRDSRAKAFLDKLVPHVAQKFSTGGDLSTGDLVRSIHPNWLGNAFMYGPTLTSLINPNSAVSSQQTLLNNAAAKVNSGSVSDYYSGSWTVLSLMVLNGDLAKISSRVTGGSPTPVTPQAPVPAPKPVPVPVPVPKPVVVPAPTSSESCTNIKYGDAPYNNWYIVIFGASGSNIVSVTCGNNAQTSCTWNADWQRHTCQPTIECPQPRTAKVNGVSCPLNPNSIARKEFDDSKTTTPFPSWGIALIVLGVLAITLSLAAIYLLVKLFKRQPETV